jgi:excisionase family DNA binding protein
MNAKLVGLQELSERIGVPVAWLRREADAGRLPHLRVGRRRLFDLAVVSQVLAERATRESEAARG